MLVPREQRVSGEIMNLLCLDTDNCETVVRGQVESCLKLVQRQINTAKARRENFEKNQGCVSDTIATFLPTLGGRIEARCVSELWQTAIAAVVGVEVRVAGVITHTVSPHSWPAMFLFALLSTNRIPVARH